MLKISDSVYEIIKGDEIALEAFRMGLLNLSAYAKQVQPQISETIYKPASIGAIVTALSRMRKRLDNVSPLKPVVSIEDMNIKTPLTEISYEKTVKSIQLASKLNSLAINDNNFFTITLGVNEISIIISDSLKTKVLKYFKIKPKGIYDNLVAVTVRFIEKDYVEIPNMIYTLVSALAVKRINIIEIVSTFTEISFIVMNKEMKQTIDSLKTFFIKKSV